MFENSNELNLKSDHLTLKIKDERWRIRLKNSVIVCIKLKVVGWMCFDQNAGRWTFERCHREMWEEEDERKNFFQMKTQERERRRIEIKK